MAARSAGAELVAVACEKPLARNVAEAKRMVELVEKARVLHGYLEDQLFSPAWSGGTPSPGRGERPSPGGPTSPAAPRSTAAPTCPGSGKASCRAGAS